MILVIGANGNVGRHVVEHLFQAGMPVRAMVRDSSRAGRVPRYVEVVRGDLTDRTSLGEAFAGARQVFLMDASHGIDNTARAIDAAVAAGVEHVVNLSSIGAALDPMPAIGQWHKDREDLIRASGLRCSFIRPGYFMSNTSAWAPAIYSDGVIRQAGGDAQFAPVDPADIAAVAAAWLIEQADLPTSPAAVITGPELLDLSGQVRVLAEVLGRPLRYEDIPDAVVASELRDAGAPGQVVEAILELTGMLRSGTLAFTSGDLERLTGRPGRPFRLWARAHADWFRDNDRDAPARHPTPTTTGRVTGS
jgi:uncharacterized protein YbjT (DUF2867 family)